jgi:hypothetical protein
MIKRLSKARRSAILEHLLALEKQIRAEFGQDTPDGTAKAPTSDADLRPQRTSSVQRGGEADESRIISNEFTARSMH